MSSLKAVVTDVHGRYETLEDSLYSLPPVANGIDLFTLGDLHGPKYDRDFLRKMERGTEDYFKNLYDYPLIGEDERKESEQFAITAENDTKNLIAVLKEHPRINLEATISGNGEQIYQQYIPYFADAESPRNLLANSGLNFVEMPDVYFYKDGRRVKDETDVDTAVLLLPYVQPRFYYNKIQRIFGDKVSDRDFVKEAVKMLIGKDGILNRIKRANPKYIIQMQHELPSKDIFERFGEPREPENKEIYEAVMEELSKYVEGTGKEYTILFGHIEKGGRFKHIINYKGRSIRTIHIKEGGHDILLFDTKTGRIYEPGELPELSDDEELSGESIEDILGEETAEEEGEGEEAEAAEEGAEA